MQLSKFKILNLIGRKSKKVAAILQRVAWCQVDWQFSKFIFQRTRSTNWTDLNSFYHRMYFFERILWARFFTYHATTILYVFHDFCRTSLERCPNFVIRLHVWLLSPSSRTIYSEISIFRNFDRLKFSKFPCKINNFLAWEIFRVTFIFLVVTTTTSLFHHTFQDFFWIRDKNRVTNRVETFQQLLFL